MVFNARAAHGCGVRLRSRAHSLPLPDDAERRHLGGGVVRGSIAPDDGAAEGGRPGVPSAAEIQRFMAVAEEVSIQRLHQRVGATMQVLVDSASAMGKKGGIGRSYADAPEIDGLVRLLPPEKISKTYKVGEFTRARIVGVEGHDLIAVPI